MLHMHADMVLFHVQGGPTFAGLMNLDSKMISAKTLPSVAAASAET
jgi:hypothetical protein